MDIFLTYFELIKNLPRKFLEKFVKILSIHFQFDQNYFLTRYFKTFT